MAEEQKHNIMTAESLKKLQERYDYLLNVKRKEIINAIEIARGFGDLSENAEYTEARNDQAKNEAEITRLKALIENAEVVDESELSTDRVSVGITVRYENTDTGAQSEYGIVGAGADEADPDEGRISSESPIGAALLGKTVGDIVDVEIPRGTLHLRIVDIHRLFVRFSHRTCAQEVSPLRRRAGGMKTDEVCPGTPSGAHFPTLI